MSIEERRMVLEEQRLELEERRELRIGGIEERRMALEERREERLLATYGVKDSGTVEPKPKRDPKITEAQRTWSRCWFGSGAEMLPNSQDPYISRSSLSEMLLSDGVSESKIKAALDPSKPSLIGSLIGSELIRFSGHGWAAVGFFADGLRVQQKK